MHLKHKHYLVCWLLILLLRCLTVALTVLSSPMLKDRSFIYSVCCQTLSTNTEIIFTFWDIINQINCNSQRQIPSANGRLKAGGASSVSLQWSGDAAEPDWHTISLGTFQKTQRDVSTGPKQSAIVGVCEIHVGVGVADVLTWLLQDQFKG